MNKVLTSVILGLTFIIPSYAEETMSYEEAFLQTIYICKDKSLYKEAKKNLEKDVMKAVDCYCNNFKDYTEDEILMKYTMAMELGIPQMDMVDSLSKAQQCVNKI